MKESLSSVILLSITAELLVPESKLFCLGISGVLEFSTDWGLESQQLPSDMDFCEASDSDSPEQVESEHAVSLQFVVGSALVILACPLELSGLKKMSQELM